MQPGQATGARSGRVEGRLQTGFSQSIADKRKNSDHRAGDYRSGSEDSGQVQYRGRPAHHNWSGRSTGQPLAVGQALIIYQIPSTNSLYSNQVDIYLWVIESRGEFIRADHWISPH